MKYFLPTMLALFLGFSGYHIFNEMLEKAKLKGMKEVEDSYAHKLEMIIQQYDQQAEKVERECNQKITTLENDHAKAMLKQEAMFEGKMQKMRKDHQQLINRAVERAKENTVRARDYYWKQVIFDTLVYERSSIREEMKKQLHEQLKDEKKQWEIEAAKRKQHRISEISMDPTQHLPEFNESLTWIFKTLFQVMVVLIILRLFQKRRRRF